MSNRGNILLVVAALPFIGLVVSVLITNDGINDFDASPAAHWAAEKAYTFAQVHRDNPLQRLLTPAAQVVMVKRMPDHCTRPKIRSYIALDSNGQQGPRAIQPGPSSPFADVEREYIAQVRFFTFFGYPADDVYITCDSASSQRPSWWPANDRS
jgi:hypothetical protein